MENWNKKSLYIITAQCDIKLATTYHCMIVLGIWNICMYPSTSLLVHINIQYNSCTQCLASAETDWWSAWQEPLYYRFFPVILCKHAGTDFQYKWTQRDGEQTACTRVQVVREKHHKWNKTSIVLTDYLWIKMCTSLTRWNPDCKQIHYIDITYWIGVDCTFYFKKSLCMSIY